MLIGRADDPQNPRRVAAFEVTNPFGCGSRNPSGPAVIVPASNRPDTRPLFAPDQIFSKTLLHSKGRPHTPYALSPDLPVVQTDGESGSMQLHSGIGRRWVKVIKHSSWDDVEPAEMCDPGAVLAVEL
jgi:hypothetical protein